MKAIEVKRTANGEIVIDELSLMRLLDLSMSLMDNIIPSGSENIETTVAMRAAMSGMCLLIDGFLFKTEDIQELTKEIGIDMHIVDNEEEADEIRKGMYS